MKIRWRLSPGRKPFKSLYLHIILWFLGRSIQAAVHIDPKIRQEFFNLPDDMTFSLGVEPQGPRMVIRKSTQTGVSYLGRASRKTPADLEIKIHDIEGAMLLLTFRESTAISASHGRISIVGNVAHGCTIVRILDQLEILLLPKCIAKRAVKRYSTPDRIGAMRTRLYVRTLIGY